MIHPKDIPYIKDNFNFDYNKCTSDNSVYSTLDKAETNFMNDFDNLSDDERKELKEKLNIAVNDAKYFIKKYDKNIADLEQLLKTYKNFKRNVLISKKFYENMQRSCDDGYYVPQELR